MMPWARTSDERGKIESTAAALLGQRFMRVAYLDVDTSSTEGWRHFDAFDEVDMGIELMTPSGEKICFLWEMHDLHEVLWVRRARPP